MKYSKCVLILLLLLCFSFAQTYELILTSGTKFSSTYLDTVLDGNVHFKYRAKYKGKFQKMTVPVDEVREIIQNEKQPYPPHHPLSRPIVTGFIGAIIGSSSGLALSILTKAQHGFLYQNVGLIGGAILGYRTTLSKKVTTTYNLSSLQSIDKVKIFGHLLDGLSLREAKFKIALKNMNRVGLITFNFSRFIERLDDPSISFSILGKDLVDDCYEIFIIEMQNRNTFQFLSLDNIVNNENYQELKASFGYKINEGLSLIAPSGMKVLPLNKKTAKTSMDYLDVDGIMLIENNLYVGEKTVNIGKISAGKAYAVIDMTIELYNKQGEIVWQDQIHNSSAGSTGHFIGFVDKTAIKDLFINTFTEITGILADKIEANKD